MPIAAATIAKTIGHTFKNSALLAAALTHPASLSRKARGKDGVPYERMEFLGDRVLNLAIAAWLYDLHPTAAEGELAKYHAALVRRETLAEAGQKLGLLDAMILAPGDRENTRGHATLLGDAMEAIFGAVYLDAGYEVAAAIVRKHLSDAVNAQDSTPHDPKTALQEWAQGRGHSLPVYRTISQTGPSHAPLFTIEVTLAKLLPVEATGTSKQEAEKAAATELLKQVLK